MPADNLIVPVDSLESGIPSMPVLETNAAIPEQNITSSQTVFFIYFIEKMERLFTLLNVKNKVFRITNQFLSHTLLGLF